MHPHLLSVDELSRDDIERILGRAESFAEVSGREIKKVPTLRGRTVINLFYEASTRTSSSFELAAKRLSADLVTVKAQGSSVDKGESLKDVKLWIVGDVLHSRVARSGILAFSRMGCEVTVCGPPTLIPRGVETLGCRVRTTLDELGEADVVYALRMQRERMD